VCVRPQLRRVKDRASRLSVGSGILPGMSTADITLDEWLCFNHQAAAATVETAARMVGGVVTSVHLHEFAGRTAYNAIIEVDRRPFVFVPGGHAELGFDPASWTPTDDEVLPRQLYSAGPGPRVCRPCLDHSRARADVRGFGGVSA
jgi:hypothetical protein